MAYLPKGLSTDADSFTVKAFYGGINTIKAEHDIADSQAASCYNVYNAEIMGLDSRYGYSRYYATALFTATLNALFTYSEFATTTFLFAASGILYKDLTSAATAVYTGIGTGTIRTFEMEGNVYMLDGSGYLVYNTSGATGVNPYIPTYWIDGNPDGTGGGQLDELNFLTSAGWQYDTIENLLGEWNKKNREPLREVYIVGQLRYHKQNKKKAKAKKHR